MADSKGETNGKALEWIGAEGEACRLAVYRKPGDYHATQGDVDDLIRMLLANPEARMAVLGAMPEFVDAQTTAATRLVSVAHLEEAAELLRCYLSGSHGEWDMRRVAWVRRDQAPHAPTAESPDTREWLVCSSCKAKRFVDRATFVCRQCLGMKCDPEPAPVAEAPERVTHARALMLLEHHSDSLPSSSAVLRRYIHEQKADSNALKYWSTRARELEASGKAERDALRAKLSESERKLGEASRPLWHGRLLKLAEKWAEEARDESGGDWVHEPLARCANELNAELMALPYATELQPAAKEPTGGEPAKLTTVEALPRCRATRKNPAGSVVQCVHPRNHLGVHSALGGEWPNQAEDWDFGNPDLNPTPPAAEAEPRFRVGQRVKVTGMQLRVGELGEVLGFNSANDGRWSVRFAGGVGRYLPNELEPADPAPPRPGGDRPLMMSELSRAIQVATKHPRDGVAYIDPEALVEALERKGSEKHG